MYFPIVKRSFGNRWVCQAADDKLRSPGETWDWWVNLDVATVGRCLVTPTPTDGNIIYRPKYTGSRLAKVNQQQLQPYRKDIA
jgi:hypothetical protein